MQKGTSAPKVNLEVDVKAIYDSAKCFVSRMQFALNQSGTNWVSHP